MKISSFNIKPKSVSYTFLFLICLTFFSCVDKKRSAAADEMELVFQRKLTAQLLFDNDRILMRIEKDVNDNGRKKEDENIFNQACHMIRIRNIYLNNIQSSDTLMCNIKEVIRMIEKPDYNELELLNYYHEILKEKKDSLIFQKFINVYLTFEKKALNDALTKVAAMRCGFGGYVAHISKTTDTIQLGQTYEIAAIPDIFDHRRSFVNDDCKITVYKNNLPIEINYMLLKKGSVYLLSLKPVEPGNYMVQGSFTQGSHDNSYVMNIIFKDTFTVNK